jgi:hypothetical protein
MTTTPQTINVTDAQQAVLAVFNALPSLPKQVGHLQAFFSTVLAARSSCGGIVDGLQGQELDSVVFAMGNAINQALPASQRVQLDPNNPDPIDLVRAVQGLVGPKVRA